MMQGSFKKIVLVFVFTSGLIIKLFAGDTIPDRKKIRIGIQGGVSSLSPVRIYDNKGDVYSNPFPYFSYSNLLNLALGIEYNLYQSTNKKNTKKLYLGLNYGVNSFDFKSGITDYSENGQAHKFDGVIYDENIKFHSARLNLAWDFVFDKWFFSQKLGVDFNAPFKSKYTVSYTETVSQSYLATSSAYVTPSNPQGWYWVNIQNQYIQKNTYKFKSALNPYYSFNIGPRFGNYYVFAGGEVSYYGNSVQFESTRSNSTSNITLINYGIIYRAQFGFAMDL